MKIIASTDNGFLIEATEDEIALVLGFQGQYDSNFKRSTLKIGTLIEVKKFNATASFVRNMDTNRLTSLRSSLTCAIEEVDDAIENVEAMKLFELIKEVGDDSNEK